MVVSEGGAGYGNSLKKTALKFATSIDSSSHGQFHCSMQCCLIAFYPQLNIFQNWSQFSQTSLCLINQLCLCNTLDSLLSFQQSLQYLHQEQISISGNPFLCKFANIANLVPDYCNKVNIIIKSQDFFLAFQCI